MSRIASNTTGNEENKAAARGMPAASKTTITGGTTSTAAGKPTTAGTLHSHYTVTAFSNIHGASTNTFTASAIISKPLLAL
jgi:hypothetical protein